MNEKLFTAEEWEFLTTAQNESLQKAKEILLEENMQRSARLLTELPDGKHKTEYITKQAKALCETFKKDLNSKLHSLASLILKK